MAATPMLTQYLEVKNKYKDYILLYRIGDFYELFFDDAKTVSQELELTLTGKDCGLEERAPMCGMPYHSVNTYIPRLIEKGHKIAICEQTEDPKQATGLVKREVTKIITPGTIVDNTLLEDKKNNYIAIYVVSHNKAVFAFADVSTGDINVSNTFENNIHLKVLDEIARVLPVEILVNEEEYNDAGTEEVRKRFDIYITEYENESKNQKISELLEECTLDKLQEKAVVSLLNYIIDTQKNTVEQISKISKYELEKFMQIDLQTRRNLEITESSREKTKKGSLLWVLDKTVTAMGGRLLRQWLQNPLLDRNEIVSRQNAVEIFKDEFVITDEISEILKTVYDIERIISKISAASCTPRELNTMRSSFANLPKLKNVLQALAKKTGDTYIHSLSDRLDTLDDIYNLLKEAIKEEPSLTIKDGDIIKDGYDEKVDDYRKAKSQGNSWLMELEAEEKAKTGIKMLKVGYNRVFGYYIEVTNSYKSMVPKERYITKQTLGGSERYITPELKQIEEKIVDAESHLNDLEYNIFCNVRNKVGAEILRVQNTAKIVATIDSLISFARVAKENNFVKPIMTDGDTINITDGRHAVVEKALRDIQFIPNDTLLNNSSDNLLIITGPNMAGKSTYMRQVALICYMAQVGSFVPASKAELCIVDRIFTRVGASDDLAMGESTFMVEMMELANILKNSTKKSLVILDEIGRGTSTYDGLAIAWATAEYIIKEIGCKTLFATHYHELTELETRFDAVKNYSVQTEEIGEDIIFLHKILRGAADESYGIYVAKLAGLPKKTLSMAKKILNELKLTDVAKKSIEESKKIDAEEIAVDMFNYQLNEVSNMIKSADLDKMSPMDSLQMLYNIKEMLK